MKISELNKQQRALINGSFHNEVEFDWEDDELLEVLLGNLPKIRLNCKEQESRKFVYEIESLYNFLRSKLYKHSLIFYRKQKICQGVNQYFLKFF